MLLYIWFKASKTINDSTVINVSTVNTLKIKKIYKRFTKWAVIWTVR